MRVLARAGREDIATVYVASLDDGRLIEFVESLEPPLKREEKWVLMVSTLYGCPVQCRFCDAGGDYKGNLTGKDILDQIDYMVRRRYPGGAIPAKKFKIQFARMGEPSYNDSVLHVLERIPEIYDCPGFMPCVSTVAPKGKEAFFEKLLVVKRDFYPDNFQLQFSIHTTDNSARDWIIPVKKWSFEQISQYGARFYAGRGRKITLNFALADNMTVNRDLMLKYFSPDVFLVKATPVNPTFTGFKNGITSDATLERFDGVLEGLRSSGYEVIRSIGEPEENLIGSNCGQYIERYKREMARLKGGYTYELTRSP